MDDFGEQAFGARGAMDDDFGDLGDLNAGLGELSGSNIVEADRDANGSVMRPQYVSYLLEPFLGS